MSNTTHLQLPFLAAAQAHKHVTVNESLLALDALLMLTVISRSLLSPPGAPAEGDRYIAPPDAAGAWSGKDGAIAAFQDGVWRFYPPRDGWRAHVIDEHRSACFLDAEWRAYDVITPNTAAMGLAMREEELTLSGAFAQTSTALIPNRAVVVGVSTRTTQTVTGASSYDCGISGEQSKFGGSLGAAAGSTNIGVIGPTAFYADTPIRITANGASFTGGKVRVAIHYIESRAPAS